MEPKAVVVAALEQGSVPTMTISTLATLVQTTSVSATSTFGDIDFGDNTGETFRSIETDKTGEASWSTIVSDRRSDNSLAQEMVFNRDGSTIHSEYAAPGDGLGWDERHTIVTSDGDRIRFERSGDMQTITDANTGEVLGRSTWERSGPEPEATLQPAFVGPAAPATIEAGAALYVWLSGRNGPDSTAIMSFEYVPGEATQAKPDWVGARTRDETNDACPRHEEVHSSLSLELSVRTRGSQCHPVR